MQEVLILRQLITQGQMGAENDSRPRRAQSDALIATFVQNV